MFYLLFFLTGSAVREFDCIFELFPDTAAAAAAAAAKILLLTPKPPSAAEEDVFTAGGGCGFTFLFLWAPIFIISLSFV